MKKERRNEIAWLVLRDFIGKEETKLQDLKRRIGNLSKKLGVPKEEFRDFTREFLTSFVDG